MLPLVEWLAAELQLLSLIHLQSSSYHNNTITLGIMWNNNNNNNNKKAQVAGTEDEDDSWEIRAFEEDITAGNQLGCTWPPRSYTCNFCRREFRSAQALGGHMNVHRRDRARLHHHHHPILPSSNSSTILVPAQEFLPNGLCLFYTLRPPNNTNPNGVFSPPSSTTDLISVSPNYPPPLHIMSANPRTNSEFSNKTGTSASNIISNDDEGDKDSELDLELRLGRGLSTEAMMIERRKKDKSP